MMNFLRKFQMHILAGILAFFLISIVMNFGGSFFVKGSPNDTVVEVNGVNVPLRKYWSYYYRSLDPNKAMDEAARVQKRDETIRDLVQSVIFAKEVERYGIHVPDVQVAISLTQFPAFQTEGKFDPRKYMQVLQSQVRTSPQDFEEEQRTSIGFYKLRWLISSSIKITDREIEQAGGYAEFAKANAVDEKKKRRTEAELRELYRNKLWNDATMYSFNQWLNQLGQSMRVKPHLDVLEGRAQG